MGASETTSSKRTSIVRKIVFVDSWLLTRWHSGQLSLSLPSRSCVLVCARNSFLWRDVMRSARHILKKRKQGHPFNHCFFAHLSVRDYFLRHDVMRSARHILKKRKHGNHRGIAHLSVRGCFLR